MNNDKSCAYCSMDTTTPYGTRGKSFGGGYVYSFISNKNNYTVVSGSNSASNKINFCPMCGEQLVK
jgi:hypothetical protein